MDKEKSLKELSELKSYIAEIMDINRALSVLEWDQQTYMPPGGTEARAEQTATLNKIAHAKIVSQELGRLIERIGGAIGTMEYDSDDAALYRQAKRFYDRNIKLSPDLVSRISRATSLAHEKWVKAREASNFSLFAPILREIIDLQIEMAEAVGYEESIYDALLDPFEPGMKTSALKRILAQLREGLIPILNAVQSSGRKIERSFLELEYDLEAQWKMSLELLESIGYDFQRGRQDRAVHPFTISFSVNDVRLTNRFFPKMMPSSVFSAIHEGGHALYDQGIPVRFDRSLLSTGVSCGLHESQSRMWENIVGRSLPFWRYWFPKFQKAYPSQLGNIKLEDFYRAINHVEPSPIRVEADEVTYNLHIILRFELEVEVLEGKIAVPDLPEAWNEKMKAYLGFAPKTDAEGVLQDVHWSNSYFGYFPSYSLGNLLSVQYFNCALKDLPGLYERFEQGDFVPLLEWLREKIHAYGAKFTPTELTQKITGGAIDPEPFISYLQKKYSEIYRL